MELLLTGRVRSGAMVLRCTLLWCLVLAAVSAAVGQETRPEDKVEKLTSAEWAERLDRTVKVIETSSDPDLIVQTYRHGCSLYSRSARLQNAYMLRMLRYGLLHMAYRPAAALAELEPHNLTALVTAGHMYASRGELGPALTLTVRAAQINSEDASVRNNLGQLVAWMELDPNAAGVSPETKRLAGELKQKLHKQFYFSEGYRRGRRVYGERKRIEDSYAKPLQRATAALDAAQKALEQAGTTAAQRVQTAEDMEKLENLRKELADVENQLRAARGSARTALKQRRDQLRGEISTLNRNVRRRNDAQKADRQTARENLARRQAALAKLKVEKRKALADVKAAYRWDPPTVNGKVMAVVQSLPNAKFIPAAGDEEEAADLLREAKLFAANGYNPQALARIREILLHYAGTDSAIEARQLQGRLHKPK